MEREIGNLGSVADLPEGSADRLRNAEEQCRRAILLLKAERSKLDKAKAERASIQWDQALLGRKGEIESLHQQRIQVKKGIADLPGLKRKLGEEQQTLVGMAPDCGWDSLDADAIVERIPQRSQLGPTRTMLADWTDKSARVESAQTAAREAASHSGKIRAAFEAVDAPRDMRDLAALVAARDQGARRGIGGTGCECPRGDDRSRGPRSIASTLQWIPARLDRRRGETGAASAREKSRTGATGNTNWTSDLRAERELLASQLKDRASTAAAVSRLAAEGEPITLNQVLNARKSRDTQWSALRKRFIDEGGRLATDGSGTAGDPQQLADSYQDAVAQADRLGDLRATGRSPPPS